MSWTKNPGRVAGLLYLLLAIAAPIRLLYIPSKLFVRGDATATASNIAAHEMLFRFGIVAIIFITLAFYRLFQGVAQKLAVLMHQG